MRPTQSVSLRAAVGEEDRSMTVEVAGETAFVTESSRGIGRGIALRLAECGVEEVGVHYHRNEAAAQETLELLRDRGAEAFLVRGDLSNLEDTRLFFEIVGGRLDSLAVFVSNARSGLDRFYEPVMEVVRPVTAMSISFVLADIDVTNAALLPGTESRIPYSVFRIPSLYSLFSFHGSTQRRNSRRTGPSILGAVSRSTGTDPSTP